MSLSEQFLREVQIFVIDLGITEKVLGSRSVGDSDVIGRLRRGQSITLRTADKITAYMAHERIRRAEAGARRTTAYQEGAYLSEAEAADREAARGRGPYPGGGWAARFRAWFRP